MMNLSAPDQLLLNTYLMLSRGALIFQSGEQPRPAILPDIQWRDINIGVLLGNLDDADEELETFLLKILNDRFSPWLSWIFVGEAALLEEVELYFNLLLGSLDSPEDSLVQSLSLSYVPDSSCWQQWEGLKNRFNAIVNLIPLGSLDSSLYLSETIQTQLKALPLLTIQDNKTIVETLYSDRLQFANTWKDLALQAFQDHQWSDAVHYYQQAIQFNPFIPAFWADLGSSLFKVQNYGEAKYAIHKAIGMNFSDSGYYYTLGLIEEALENWDGAIEAYQHSIHLDPEQIKSYCSLGNLLSTLEAWNAAETVYQDGLAKSIWHFGLYLNWGNLFVKTNRLSEAIRAYKKALQLAPNNPEALHNLALACVDRPDLQAFYQGKLLESQQNYSEACLAYQRSLAANPTHFESALRLVECYQELRQTDAARQLVAETLETLATTTPLDSSHLRSLLLCLNKQSESHVSQTLSKLHPFFKTPEIQRLLEAIHFPILYSTPDQILTCRKHFENAIDSVACLDFKDPFIQAELFSFFRSFIHAFLNYQCQNDRAIQSKCAAIVQTLLSARYPQDQNILSSAREGLKVTGKIRVGYASYYLRRHNGARWALGWIRNHDREKFEVFTYHFGDILDSYTKAFCDASHSFKHLPEVDCDSFEDWLNNAIDTLKNDRLDVLIFPEIGMEPRTYMLSKLRLAPIQCTAWGHPITSGSSCIDYYLSSHLMESDQAQTHYTEKLVRLPHLGLCYPNPQVPECQQQRSFFQLPEERIIYLSCQSLFKYLPQYDYLYPAIAKQVPQAYFVFLETFLLGNQFSQRLEQSFNQAGLVSQAYCKILPKQSWQNYIQLQYLADIYLDTIAWTGGNSTLEAIGCGLPVVTYPGEQMRGRHSSAILQRLGVTETIAHSLEEYIEIAVELGQNPSWRQQITRQYRAKSQRLFNDRRVTHSLDQVLLTLSQQVSS